MACLQVKSEKSSVKSSKEDGLQDCCKASEAKSTLVVKNKNKNVGDRDQDQLEPIQPHPLFEEKLSELLLTFHNLPLIPNETALNLLKIQSSK